MKRMMGAILFALLLLTASALAADLDTPRIGAAVCAPEEENGSVVLHEAPDGRSETLMRYFQGAPLQVLDLADGWAHVRMGMTGKSLEGYIRQERLKYGAEAMREVQQHAEVPGFDEDTSVYEACDKQSGVIDTLAAPCGMKIMGYNGQWAAVWGENGFIPMTGTIRPGRWDSPWLVLPLAGELTKEEALRKLREMVPQKREEWNISEVYTDARVLDEDMRWHCSDLFYEPLTGKTYYLVYMDDPLLMDGRKWSMDTLMVEMSAKGEVMEVYNTLPQTGVAVCTPVEESDTVTLYAEPDESSDMLFHYYSGTAAEALEVQRAWIRVRVGRGEAALEGWMPARDLTYGAWRERDVAHVVRWYTAEAGEQAVYAAPDESAKVLHQTLPSEIVEANGIGTDGWVQLSWYDNEPATGFARLGDDTELGKPMRAEVYHVDPLDDELSFEEAEEKAREYAWQYGKKHGKGWKRSKKAVDGAACEMQLMYVEQTRQADYCVWFYQAGNEEDGIAVEMTPQGELIAADEGFG